MSNLSLEQARKQSFKKTQSEIKINNSTTYDHDLEDEIFKDTGSKDYVNPKTPVIPDMKELGDILTRKPSVVEKVNILGRTESKTKKVSAFDLEDEIFNDEPKDMKKTPSYQAPKKQESKVDVKIPPLNLNTEEKKPQKKNSFDLEDEIFADLNEPEPPKKEEPKVAPKIPTLNFEKKEEPKKPVVKKDLEDEIFGSEDEKPETPKKKETPKKEEPKPVVVPTVNLDSVKKQDPPKKKDLEDEIFGGDDEKPETPKKEPEKKPIVIPKLELQQEPQPVTPKKEEPKQDAPNLTSPKSNNNILSPKSKGKSVLNNILSPKPEIKEVNDDQDPNLKHMTKEEREESKRIRSKSQKRQSVAIQKKKTKTLDDFDGNEYIRATVKEGYLIKPNTDMTKAYKRWCIAEKLEGRILFTVWKSRKYVNSGEPIQKIIINQEVQREAVLFKTKKKSQSYDSDKEFHDVLVIYFGKAKEPLRLWCRDDFEAREWELTLKCMLYFDEDDEDDESDSDDDEKVKIEKRQRRLKRKEEKKQKQKEKRKQMGCFGKIYEFIFNK